MKVGGYTEFRVLTDEDRAIYNKVAMPDGIAFTPLVVATQVVAGTNYCFLGNAKPVIPDAESHPAKVVVFVGLDGTVQLTEICNLDI